MGNSPLLYSINDVLRQGRFLVHEPLQQGTEYTTLGDILRLDRPPLVTEVDAICESRGPVSTSELSPSGGREVALSICSDQLGRCRA
ncbi:hypothetical protein VTK26DRAFT_6020 [Humicola hyalothermophila]